MNVKSFWIRAILIVILIFTLLNFAVSPAYAQEQHGKSERTEKRERHDDRHKQPPRPKDEEEIIRCNENHKCKEG